MSKRDAHSSVFHRFSCSRLVSNSRVRQGGGEEVELQLLVADPGVWAIGLLSLGFLQT